MEPSERRLRLELRILLVTTRDAIRKSRRDPVSRELALVRARRMLGELEARIEKSPDPEVREIYGELASLIGGGLLVIAVAR
jgi:hypothetical protein